MDTDTTPASSDLAGDDQLARHRLLLVVCTANTCRSPVAAALLDRRLSRCVDVDGHRWRVRSAGIERHDGGLDPDMVEAAATLDVDITEHVPRRVGPADLNSASLVLTMTRHQLRTLVAAEPSVWPRTFTLREIVRRTEGLAPTGGGVDGWLQAAGHGRRTADLIGASADDDIVDPYGRGPA
ncbi:MAG: hypothetical protein ACRD0G_10045, partial [Acidimicrobiales bacterium]